MSFLAESGKVPFGSKKEGEMLKRHLCKNQQGSIAVVVALLLPIALGCVALAVDMGNLVLNKTQLRNAVDAAIYAGAQALPSGESAASAAATSYLSSNGYSDVTPTITYAKDAVRNPNNYPEINITASKTIPTSLMGILGNNNVTLTVTAKAINPINTLQPPFTYLLFSNQNLTMNGSQHAQGSIHSNGETRVNGSQVIGGNVEGYRGITMVGSERVSGYVQADTLEHIRVVGSEVIEGGKKAGATNVAMPDFSVQIVAATATADKYLSGVLKEGNANWDGTTFTFNGSNVTGHTIYVEGNVTINGSISWTGSILATGHITISGSSQIMGSNQVFVYSKSGNIVANGSCSFGSTSGSCIAYAPLGNITVNGSSHWYGRIIGNTLTLNGSGNFYGTYVNESLALPYGIATNSKPQIIM